MPGAGVGAGAAEQFYLEPDPEPEPDCFPGAGAGAGAGADQKCHGSASLLRTNRTNRYCLIGLDIILKTPYHNTSPGGLVTGEENIIALHLFKLNLE